MKKLLLPALIILLLTAGCIYLPGGPACAPLTPNINTFDANPASISPGGTSTLSWNVSGATAVTIDQGIGAVALTGSRSVTPTATTIYTLTATGAGGKVTATAQVVVSGTSASPGAPEPTPSPPAPSPAAGLPVINYFSANPPIIPAGSTATLSWSVSNATTMTIDQGIGNVGLVGTAPVSPLVTTSYTLTATNAAGWYSNTITVGVTGALPPSFAVTSITATVDPPSFNGLCPKTFYFYGVITVNGPGMVTYKWERSDGAIAPTYSITFGSAGSQMVTTSWQLGASYSGWQRLHVFTPNDAVSNQANFTLNCGGFAVTGVTASVSPPFYTGPCPKAFNFSAVITANGPGIVTYKWERSDGASAPVQSVTFPAAGSVTVATSWTLGAEGSKWERLHVLTPDDMVSNQAIFTLDCTP